MAGKRSDAISKARRAERLALTRAQKMARSAHAYVRGNTVKFYEWLEQSDRCALPEGPPIWICGDCHVGNLGPLASKEGRVQIQIRDLDQTVIGNPAHDLVRLGLSLAMAARGSDLPGATTALMVEQMVKGYSEALVSSVSRKTIREREDEAVGEVLNQALKRRWKHLAQERIKDVRPTIPANDRFWPLNKSERGEIEALVQSSDVRQLVTSLGSRKDDARVALLDAAYWVKGCSSLGRLRYAVLVGVGKKHDADGGLCLLDFKEATSAAAPRAPGIAMPSDNAVRVVTGARALSPNLGQRMIAGKLSGKPVVIRELLPQDLKLEVDSLTREQAVRVARYLAGVVGHAHARQMDRATRADWRKELQRFSAKLDAPPWLWNSVVELVASHEAGYLEHCRKHALAA
jgi:uncharacterized protein (DUF2252 family)